MESDQSLSLDERERYESRKHCGPFGLVADGTALERARGTSRMRPHWPAAAAIFLVALIAACGTTPVPSSSAKPIPAGRIKAPEFTRAEEGFALVVVTRDTGLRAVACDARLHVDGTLVAELRPSEQIRLFLEEGQHLVGVSTEGCLGGADQVTIDVSRAKPVLLRISAGHGDGITIEPSAF